MILIITDIHDNSETVYPLRTVEDFEKLAEHYPRVDKIAMWANTLNEAAYQIRDYLRGSSFIHVKLIEDDPMRKSLKTKVAGAAVAAATMIPQPANLTSDYPQEAETYAMLSDYPASMESKKEGEFGTQKEDKFLWNLSQLESSGGDNIDHPTITWDHPMKGQKAMGKWGLLKPTVDEIVNRHNLEGSNKYDHLRDMDRDQLSDYLGKNPDVELDLARYLARLVLTNQRGNEHKAAYAWLNGHNLSPKSITKDHIKNSDYVSKYKIYDHINPYNTKGNVTKSEIPEMPYKERLKAWFRYREEKERQPLPRDTTFVSDLGNQRTKENEAISPKTGTTIDKIKAAIEDARKGHKK